MATKKKQKKGKNDPAADALEAIKRLLILQLITSGVKGRDVASALGVHESVVSRMLAKRKVKRSSKKR
jgi:predicted transcriptional regulator